MSKVRPHTAGITAFDGGELRKQFSAMSLNKVRTTYGGGSGYRSEARKPITEESRLAMSGKEIPPSKVVKTIIHYNVKGELKAIGKAGYIVRNQAFNMVPFVYQVDYVDLMDNVMTIKNTNIK